MERLTWVSGSFSAHVLNARLRSEGIDAELRGPVDGPYALTVGDLARVEGYVPADQMDDAQLVVLGPEGDDARATPRVGGCTTRPRGSGAGGAGVAALVAVAAERIVLYARLGCRFAAQAARSRPSSSPFTRRKARPRTPRWSTPT